MVDPAVFLGTTYYVNDATEDEDDDGDVTAPGSATNDGLSREQPMQSVQQVLNTYDLQPNDIIAVFSGSYGSFTVGAEDSGVRISGRADDVTIAGIVLDGASGVTIQDLNVVSRHVELLGDLPAITVTGGSNVVITRNSIEGGISISGGSGIRVARNDIVGVQPHLFSPASTSVAEQQTSSSTRTRSTAGRGACDWAMRPRSKSQERVHRIAPLASRLWRAASGEIGDNTIVRDKRATPICRRLYLVQSTATRSTATRSA